MKNFRNPGQTDSQVKARLQNQNLGFRRVAKRAGKKKKHVNFTHTIMTCDQLVSTCVGWLDCEKLASTCVRISVLIKVSPLASPVQSSPLVSPSVQSFDQSLRVLDYSSLCLRKDLRVTGYKTYSISSKTCGRVFIETSQTFFRIYQRTIIWWLYQELCLVSWYRGTVKRRSNTTSRRTRSSTQVPAWINTLLGLLGSFRFFRWMVSFPLFTRL